MTQVLEHPETATLTGCVALNDSAAAGAEGCALCGETSRKLFQKYNVWIRECPRCTHRFAVPNEQSGHVAAQYDDDYFFGGGAGYDDYLSEAKLLTAHGRRYARILSRLAQPGRLLDVGAAAGFILQGLADAGWDGHGIEPNATMARHAREQLNLDVACGTLEDMPTDSPFDVVSMIQVVAHFLDPHQATRQARRPVPGRDLERPQLVGAPLRSELARVQSAERSAVVLASHAEPPVCRSRFRADRAGTPGEEDLDRPCAVAAGAWSGPVTRRPSWSGRSQMSAGRSDAAVPVRRSVLGRVSPRLRTAF